MITFFGPGIIWFYFGFRDQECHAPIEESMHVLVVCYFVAAILLFLPAINMCAKKICCGFCCVPFFYSTYLIGKFVLLIVMLTYAQDEYYRNWDDNLCPELESWTLGWLIINYIMLGCTFIYSLFFMGIAFCDCDYDFDDYDLDY